MKLVGFDRPSQAGRLGAMRSRGVAVWLGAFVLVGCGNAPAFVPPTTTGTPLTLSATSPGKITSIYSGSDGQGHAVTLQVDAAGTVAMAYAAALTPAGGTALAISHTGTWAGLLGVGTFWFTTDTDTFPDAVTPSLTDSDAVAGTLQLADDGTFTLLLTVSAVRYPTGAAPAQTTVSQVTYTGAIVSGST